MKKILFLLLLTVCALPAAAQVKFETKPTDTIHEMAKQQNKLVFIDLYADWCPPCRVMEKQVFSRGDVGDFMNKHFINAKYDIDQYPGSELVKKYNAEGVPTYLIFNVDGELLGRIVGASSPEQFLLDVQKIVSGKLPK